MNVSNELNKYQAITNKLNLKFKYEKQRGQNYGGYYDGSELCIVESNDNTRIKIFNGEMFQYETSFLHVFLHELTHHLQYGDNRYDDMMQYPYMSSNKTKHQNCIYAYNEIVANSVSMLIQNTEDSIKNNISYVNNYYKRVMSASNERNKQRFLKELENNLETDVNKYYTILKDLAEKEGII